MYRERDNTWRLTTDAHQTRDRETLLRDNSLGNDAEAQAQAQQAQGRNYGTSRPAVQMKVISEVVSSVHSGLMGGDEDAEG